jgi:hypothetical protein
MTGVVALFSAALSLTALPPLPQQGLAVETKAGVQLQTLRGRPIATLPGVDFAMDQATAHTLVLRNRRGELFALNAAARRLLPRIAHGGCRTTDVELVVCPRLIRGSTGVLARAPGKVGHWVWASRSPRGKEVLAQWSAECEVPVAYLIAGGKLRAYGSEAVALGWLPSGAALIHFPNGPCAGTSHARGIYAVPSAGTARLMLKTPRFAQYAMWGG